MNDDNANDDINRPDWLGIVAIIILIAFLAPAILAAIVPRRIACVHRRAPALVDFQALTRR